MVKPYFNNNGDIEITSVFLLVIMLFQLAIKCTTKWIQFLLIDRRLLHALIDF